MSVLKPYEYGRGYIYLPVEGLTGLPETVEHDGIVLHKKSELHVSLVSIEKLTQKALVDAATFEDGCLELFNRFVRTQPLDDIVLTGELRYATKRDKRSIVAMATVAGIDELFTDLSERSNADLPVQPTHVTLYTAQPDMGISISSYDELDAISVPVEIAALNGLISS
jgi:hypothetical protein